jgi:WD40 repeat protein
MGGILKTSYIRLSFMQNRKSEYVLLVPTGKYPYSNSIWLHPSEGQEAVSVHKPVKVIFNPPGERGIKNMMSLLPPESWQGYPSSIVFYNQKDEKRIYIAYRTGPGDNEIYWSIADATDFHKKPSLMTTSNPLKKVDEIISFPIMVAVMAIGFSSTGGKKDLCTPHSYYNSVAFSPDGQYALSGSSDRAVKLWNINSGEKIRVHTGHTDNIRYVAFSPDGRNFISGGLDRKIKLWDFNSGLLINTFTGANWAIDSAAVFTPDGNHLLLGNWDGAVILWNIPSAQEVRTYKNTSSRHMFGSERINAVAASPDGQYAIAANSKAEINLWAIESNRHIRTFSGHHYMNVRSVAFSPDSRYALSGGDFKDQTMKLWEIASGWEIRSLKQHSGDVNSVAFSSDSRYILSGNGIGCILLWELATGRLVRVFEGHRGSVQSVAFSPDGRLILSGSEDETLKLWDVESGKEIRTFKAEPEKYPSKYKYCDKGNTPDR